MALALVGAGTANAASIINVAMLGAGGGRVVDKTAKGGIDCPAQCSADYVRYFHFRSSATLSASPGNTSFFKGWGGVCSGTQPTCVIAAFSNSTRAATARFEPLPLFGTSGLSVSVAGAGAGTVTGPGVACPGDCTQSYLKSAAVALTATPAAGSSFAGWSGACSGTSPSCNLTMGDGRTVTATFRADPASPGSTPTPGPTGTTGGGGAAGGGGSPAKPGRCTVRGTAGADVLAGTPGRDVICGLGGKDTLIGKGGGDTLIGGRGADLLRGGRGRDVLYARDRRSDRLNGGPGSDRARVDTRRDVRRSIESLF